MVSNITSIVDCKMKQTFYINTEKANLEKKIVSHVGIVGGITASIEIFIYFLKKEMLISQFPLYFTCFVY